MTGLPVQKLPESILDAWYPPREETRRGLNWKQGRELLAIAPELQTELFPDAHEPQLRLIVDADGKVRFIWDDVLQPFMEMGTAYVKRASHVEPWPGGGWIADLSPIEGPILGPFELRGQALAAERQWLGKNAGL